LRLGGKAGSGTPEAPGAGRTDICRYLGPRDAVRL